MNQDVISPFSVEESMKVQIMRDFMNHYLTTQSTPDDWDIEAYPVFKKMNDVGAEHLSDDELLNLYKEVKDKILPPPVVAAPQGQTTPPSKDSGLVFLKSSDLVSKPIEWLWQDKIAKGKVTLIAGDPGLGKSQTTIFLAGVVSNGGTFPGGHQCKQGRVLFFSAEDDPEDTINPRLQAVDANRENIFIFSIAKRDGKERGFDLSKDMDLLKKSIEEAKNVSLIIVDPITAFLGDTDSHVNAEVRALLSMLSKIASEHKIAIVVVTHLNKSTGGSPLNKITGSLAFVAAARAAYMVIKDENDDQRRLFLPVKNNLAEDKSGFAFKVEGVEVGPDKIRTSRVKWENDPISMSAVEAMSAGGDNGGRHGSSGVDHKTVDRLEGILKKFPDGLTTEDFAREAMRIGISKRTLYRAEKDMMIEKVTSGKFNKKVWKLIFNEDGMINDDITADAVSKM